MYFSVSFSFFQGYIDVKKVHDVLIDVVPCIKKKEYQRLVERTYTYTHNKKFNEWVVVL